MIQIPTHCAPVQAVGRQGATRTTTSTKLLAAATIRVVMTTARRTALLAAPAAFQCCDRDTKDRTGDVREADELRIHYVVTH